NWSTLSVGYCCKFHHLLLRRQEVKLRHIWRGIINGITSQSGGWQQQQQQKQQQQWKQSQHLISHIFVFFSLSLCFLK
ncbi:hypothetical protein AALO_G00101430, partial [Alosa alosa]